MILNWGLPHSKTHILNQDGGSVPGRALQGTNAWSPEKLGRCPEQELLCGLEQESRQAGEPAVVTVGVGAVCGGSQGNSHFWRVLKGCGNQPDKFSRKETLGIWDLKSEDFQKWGEAKKGLPGRIKGERRESNRAGSWVQVKCSILTWAPSSFLPEGLWVRETQHEATVKRAANSQCSRIYLHRPRPPG